MSLSVYGPGTRIKGFASTSMFKIYDRYLLRQMMVTTMVVAGGLSMIILLTQSLRLIEVVLESNASSRAFFELLVLSYPRFIEAVLPASVLISTLFVFHRLTIDSELVVLRSSGASPMRLAKPVLTAGAFLAFILLILSLWISPSGIYKMQAMRKEIRAQYAHLLFNEGVFNTVGQNLTAFVSKRASDGRLEGLMIHDTRGVKNGGPAVTVVAHSGNMMMEGDKQKIIVYDGSRQEHDAKTGKFSRLDFQQYTIEIPASDNDVAVRWREPDERTFGQLTDPEVLRTAAKDDRLQFRAELHRRFSTPILMLSFALIGAAALLLGPYSRAGQMPLVGVAAVSSLLLQGVYLTVFAMAKKTFIGCILLYLVAALPLLIALFFLTPTGERMIARLNIFLSGLRHKGQK